MTILGKSGLGISLAVAGLLFGVSAAQGIVYDANSPGDEDIKAYNKFQKDVGTQVGKVASKLAKAMVKCTLAADPNTMEPPFPSGKCSVVDPDGLSVGIDDDTLAKFKKAIDKAVDKVNMSKKLPDGLNSAQGYAALGCPEDIEGGVPSDPNNEINDMATFEAAVIASAKEKVESQADQLPFACATAGAANGQETLDCLKALAKAAVVYNKSYFKCIIKCETDLKDKKGGGGLTDDENLCMKTLTADAAAQCEGKAKAKADKAAEKNAIAKLLWPAVVYGAVKDALDETQTDFYNLTPAYSDPNDGAGCHEPCPDPICP